MTTASVPEIQTDKGFLPRQTKLLLGAFVILGAIGFIVFNALAGNQQYFMTLSEMKAKGDLAYRETVRVGGNLVPNTTKVDTKNVTAQFTLTDDQNNVLPVYYKGILPDTFEKSTQVIAEGKLDQNGVFQASLVLAKCPSKYDPSKLDWYSSTQPGNLNYSTGPSN
jgi:cytochrome c-type biogenesis protein CcmE